MVTLTSKLKQMKKLLLSALLFISLAPISAFATEGNNQTTDEKPKNTILSVLMDKVTLSGYGQMGYTYNSNETGRTERISSNTFDVKRVMFMADANITRNIKMYFMYDFAGGKMHEIWGEYAFCEGLKLKAGQFKVPFSIESLLSPSTLEIISGAQSINYLAGIPATDVAYGGNGGRDLGVMIHGKLLPYQSHKLLSYHLGVFNGQGINTKDLNKHKDLAAWLMIYPLKEVGIGGSVYLGKGHAIADSPFLDFKEGDNYKRNRWSVGTEITTTPLYVRAEYLRGKDGNIDSEGYYAVANFHVLPKLDIIASYDYFAPVTEIKEDYDVVPNQTNYILGAQWNFYRRCRLQLQYIYQDRASGWKNANLIMTQFQVGF